MFGLSAEVLALIGAIFGGGGLKFIEHWLNRNKAKDDTATAFRNELREEVKVLRNELRLVEEELDEWREKYYAVVEEMSHVKIDRDSALASIKHAAQDAQRAANALGNKPSETERAALEEVETAAQEAAEVLRNSPHR